MSHFIVDSHCHLDLIEQKGLNINDVVKSASDNNVQLLQTICTKITEFDKIYQYTQQYDQVFASIGIHPSNVDEQPEFDEEKTIQICKTHKKVIGIGETGLDYYYDNADRKNQRKSLIKHINVSRETNLPLIIHNRDSDKDMMEILESEMKKGEFKILLHCFSSSEDLAIKAIDLGGFVSISGIVTFKNALELQKIVKKLPLERILVETDAPFLAPVPHRGQVNQPAFTKNTAEFVANLKGVELKEVAEKTTANFFRLFENVSRETNGVGFTTGVN